MGVRRVIYLIMSRNHTDFHKNAPERVHDVEMGAQSGMALAAYGLESRLHGPNPQTQIPPETLKHAES